MPVTKPLKVKKWIELANDTTLHDEIFHDAVILILDDDAQIKNCHFTDQATIIFKSKQTRVTCCVFEGESIFVGAYSGEPDIYDTPIIKNCYFTKRVTLLGKPVGMLWCIVNVGEDTWKRLTGKR